MKTATENLIAEHVHILRLIDVMEQISKHPDPDVLHLESIVEIIRNFADGLHHAKEENLLFIKMAEKGFSFQQGPIAVMMHDHVQGRLYVKGMADNIASYKAGNLTALTDIFQHMKSYCELLKAHITKENNILFKMADNVLSDAEQKELLAQFTKVEKSHVCGGVVANCISRIDELATVYSKEKSIY